MPNLIIEAVPPHQTGEATGFNALVRSVGSSLGSQVSAAILVRRRGGRRDRPRLHTRLRRLRGRSGLRGRRRDLHPARRGTCTHAPIEEIGAAGPLAEPAISREEF